MTVDPTKVLSSGGNGNERPCEAGPELCLGVAHALLQLIAIRQSLADG